jgi:hypothetical protein
MLIPLDAAVSIWDASYPEYVMNVILGRKPNANFV